MPPDLSNPPGPDNRKAATGPAPPAESGKTPFAKEASKPGPDTLIPPGTTGIESQRTLNNRMFEAAWKGDLEKLKDTLAMGADPFAKDSRGWTAPMYASLCGHTFIVEYLAGIGVRIDTTSKSGESVMSLAIEGHFKDLAEFACRHGAKK